MRPLEDGVIVKRDVEHELSKGGIYLPDSVKEAPQRGTVYEVGPGKTLDNGSKIPMSVKKGENVLFGKYAGTKITVDDQELLFMREADILAVLED